MMMMMMVMMMMEPYDYDDAASTDDNAHMNYKYTAADAVPRHIVTNPAGFALHQNGVAYTNIVATGAWNATALAGVCNLKALAGVVNITAGAAMNLTATAAVNIKGLSIFLN